ncbi:amidohydrolase family protein [Desulforhopalus sp. 52FAK]
MSISAQTYTKRIVCAPWLLTMTGRAVKDGAVLLGDGQIQDVSEVELLSARYPDIEVEYFTGVFLPALVNAHSHLELSHLTGIKPLAPEKTFTDWVEDLLEQRFGPGSSENTILEIAREQVAQQFESGVVFIGDIGNSFLGSSLAPKKDQLPEVYHMLEMLGSSKEAVEAAYNRLSEFDSEVITVPHAPYSTRPELLKKIKQRSDKLGSIFSVHTAEVSAETDFIRSAEGLFYDFLVKRGVWKDDFFEYGSNAGTTVEYFSNLGLLNDKTLLVHCVHVTQADLVSIKESGAHICVCPGSNNFLHSGKAPIEDMVSCGLLPAIGTDSIASNSHLDMWEEMKIIRRDYPALKASDILAMATKAGADAFGQSDRFGTIAKGKNAAFLHVYSNKSINCITESELLNMLVSNGRPEKIEWIQQTFGNPRSN